MAIAADPVLPSPLARLRASPTAFLMALTFVNWLGFASWSALINNFAADAAGFSWNGIGLMQSVREIPGFLAFTAIFWIIVFREQTFAYLSLLVLSAGIAVTGAFPTMSGILLTTFLMSVGFHYLETMNQSLSLQLLSKKEAPKAMGRIAGAGAVAQFLAYGGLAIAAYVGFTTYQTLFLWVGGASLVLAVVATLFFQRFDGTVPQRKTLVIRRRYWLYYALTFMSGARRQIFMAFAAFLLVKSFGYSIFDVSMLFLVTAALNTVMGPVLGQIVGRFGERPTIIFENVVLIGVFAGYALAASGGFGEHGKTVAGVLYVVDGVFFTLAIAQRTYFQKIGDAADMAPTAAVSFTINHIMAVVIPVTFGMLGMADPSIIFWLGCVIATISLTLAFIVPRDPGPGNETVLSGREPAGAAQPA